MTRTSGFTLCVALAGLVTVMATKASQDPPGVTPQAGSIGVNAFDDNAGTLDERIQRGFEIAPVPLDLQSKDVGLVGLGSYIVNAQGGCNDCHTNPPYKEGGNPFLGQPGRINSTRYLAGGTSFGPFVSRNLTPQAGGRPAGLTWEQFRLVIRTGIDLDKVPPNVPSAEKDLLQVMPWPVFRHMRLVDLRAIYEYLRAIPSKPSAPGTPR